MHVDQVARFDDRVVLPLPAGILQGVGEMRNLTLELVDVLYLFEVLLRSNKSRGGVLVGSPLVVVAGVHTSGNLQVHQVSR